MEKSYHHIRQLYLENLTGTISEEDDARLHDLLQNDAQALSIWKRLEEENRELNADAVLARIDPENELEQWKEWTGHQDRPVHWLSWWQWSAAAAIVVCLGASYIFRNQLTLGLFSADKSSSIQQDTAQKSGVKLVLGDGKSVVFSRDKPQKFSIAGIELNNSGDQLQYEGSTGESSAINTLIVPEKEDYEITLSDGTRVSLNAQSRLQFPFHFTGGVREVYLQGEAYLEVAKDSKHPFIVHTALADILVTGTSFNVNTYEEGTIRTALIEGKVSLRAADLKPLELVPGLEAQYTEHAGFTTVRFDPGEVLSWRQGVYYFHNQRLEDLKELIFRWFGVEVVFENKNLAQHTVSGMIEKEHLTEFLDDLTATSGITYVQKGTVLFLK